MTNQNILLGLYQGRALCNETPHVLSTMPIEPLQLEPDLPEHDIEHDNDNGNDNEVTAKPALCITARSKVTKNRFLIFCAVVSAAVGLRHVLGFSSGSTTTRLESTSESLPDYGRLDESFNPGVDRMDEPSFNPGVEIEKILCDLAKQIPTDGIINLGQIVTTPKTDKTLDAVPSCFENADHLRSWYSSWYWIRRPSSGKFTANFNEVFKPANNTSAFDIHVSAYEGDCGEVLECVGTQGIENGRHGSTTWTTVKGKTYLLRVQHMPGTKFEVPVVTGDSRE
jgi:hypothetical protein